MRKAAMAGMLLVVVFAVASCSDDDSTGSKESTPPLVEIQTPWDGSTREGNVDVVIEATDDAGISKVEFYANGQLIKTDTMAPYEFQWDLSVYDDNTQVTFYAKAVDNNGNVKISPTRTLTKGPSEPPTAEITDPHDGWTVMQGYLTELKGTAVDEGVNLTAENVVWSSNLQGVLKSGTDVEYRGFVIGTHEITMKAIDSDGNIDTDTITITVTDNDQDYAYIQEGAYRIGPPLFDAEEVRFSKPFIISKTELSLRDFLENLDTSHLAVSNELTTRKKDLDSKAESTGLPMYDSAIITDVDMYGDYPATFFTLLEYIAYCESLNDRDGYNISYKYYNQDGEVPTKLTTAYTTVLMTKGDNSYDLNGWRLPTEAEWMVAASGGISSENNGIEVPAYPWGDKSPRSYANTVSDDSPPNMIEISLNRGTVPVNSYAEYKNPFGILNMAGNVAEVCSDMYLPYLPSGTDYCGYLEAQYVEYVVKGGAWYSSGLDTMISIRTMWIPFVSLAKNNKSSYNDGIGARIVRSLKVGEAPW